MPTPAGRVPARRAARGAARAVVVDQGDRYAGIVLVPEAHAPDSKAETLADCCTTGRVLLPPMTIKDAVSSSSRRRADALVVVDGIESRRVIGLLTEAVCAAPLQRGARPAAAGAVGGVT